MSNKKEEFEKFLKDNNITFDFDEEEQKELDLGMKIIELLKESGLSKNRILKVLTEIFLSFDYSFNHIDEMDLEEYLNDLESGVNKNTND